jgi:hypothetical protein
VVGDTKEQNGADAELGSLARIFDELIDRRLTNAGHGADWFAYSRRRHDEKRQNQVAWSKRCFAHERAQRACTAQPAAPIFRK